LAFEERKLRLKVKKPFASALFYLFENKNLQMVCRWSFYSKSLESFNQALPTKFPLPSFLYQVSSKLSHQALPTLATGGCGAALLAPKIKK
jgi:hypothetical protein